MKNLYVDFHVLQTVPPSCINRDDLNSPKTAIYGGVTRARVSSQAWKRAMRLRFDDVLEWEEVGVRTKKVKDMIKEQILLLSPDSPDAKVNDLATEAMNFIGFSIDKKTGDASTMTFISRAQAAEIARLIVVADCTDPKEYKKALQENPSVDMVLFGRMMAIGNTSDYNYDACAQVAHAISTHAVQTEFDFFTAVDDRAKAENDIGSGHLGTAEFESETLYRYATLNATALMKQFESNRIGYIVNAFADAFIRSMPTGKQNSYANRTLPDAVYITIREDQPVNLCGAFEKPVMKTIQGYVAASEKALAEYAKYVYENFASEPVKAYTVGAGLDELAAPASLKDVLAALEKDVPELLAKTGEVE